MPDSSDIVPEKPYRVKLYDAFERLWIDLSETHNFDNEADAVNDRDEMQKKIDPKSPDHYGVIKMVSETRGYEINCLRQH